MQLQVMAFIFMGSLTTTFAPFSKQAVHNNFFVSNGNSNSKVSFIFNHIFIGSLVKNELFSQKISSADVLLVSKNTSNYDVFYDSRVNPRTPLFRRICFLQYKPHDSYQPSISSYFYITCSINFDAGTFYVLISLVNKHQF